MLAWKGTIVRHCHFPKLLVCLYLVIVDNCFGYVDNVDNCFGLVCLYLVIMDNCYGYVDIVDNYYGLVCLYSRLPSLSPASSLSTSTGDD